MRMFLLAVGIAVGLLALVIGVLVIASGPPSRQTSAPIFDPIGGSDPTYEGTPLSQWVRQFNDVDAETRQNAIPALVAIGKPAVPHLVRCLRSDDRMMREQATGALGTIGRDAAAAIPEIESLRRSGRISDKLAASVLREIKGR